MELCSSLPQGWAAASCDTNGGIIIGRRLALKAAAKLKRERMAAFWKREQKRGKCGQSLSASRKAVYRETIAEPVKVESGKRLFALGQGRRQPKKAKNGFSKEEAGTVGSVIRVRRFKNSRLTCVYKCKAI